MGEINLTTRKHSPPPKIIGSHIYDENTKEYVVRYSEAYREEGHDFNKSFRVLRSAYWFKYEIIDQDDIATYETLQFLCERAIPFTIEVLAEKSKCGKATLRQRLDNLENAELLEIVKTDGQGQPNYYILRTPYFERDSLIGDSDSHIWKQDKILKKYKSLPETFLEENILRLKRQVKKNRIKKLRELYRQKKLEKKNKTLYQQLKSSIEAKKLVWFNILKIVGMKKAVSLDNEIWRYAKSDFSSVESTAFNQMLRERIKAILRRLEIVHDAFLIDFVERLFHFYCPNVYLAPPKKKQTAAAGPSADDRSETEEFLLRVLQKRKEKTESYTFKELILVFREALKVLKFAEIEALAKSYFDSDQWQKLSVELRN